MGTEKQDSQLTDLYNRGLALFKTGDISSAVKCFQQVVEIDPNCSPAWNNLGVAAYRENNIEEAELFFQKACESDPENIDAITNIADLYFSTKKYRKAEKLYTFLSQKNPERSENFLRLGDCYIVFAEYNSAFVCYKKAFELEPTNEVIENRVQILASALTPIPFAVSSSPADVSIKVGLGVGLEHLYSLFESPGFEIISLSDSFDSSEHYFAPLDITLVKNDPSFYESNLPVLCKILIFDTIPEPLSMTDSERIRNIDYVLCTSEESQDILIEMHNFAPYQVTVMEVGELQVMNDPDGIKRKFLEFLAEMILFYAQRLELKDCHEQAYWLLEKAARKLPHIQEIVQRYKETQNKINHLFDSNAYKKLYDESADISLPQFDVTSMKRYGWLLNQIKSFPGIHSLVDVGCHKGEFCFALAEEGYNMTGVDIAEKNIKETHRYLDSHKNFTGQLEFHVSLADQIDTLFPENRFDGAILMEILEHVPDVDSVLKAVDKVVKPGGYVFITVPYTHLEMIYQIVFMETREFPEHVRRFSPENIPAYFRDKEGLFWEEITAESGADQQKWLGIRYRSA